ncbi:hypothetical protein BM1_00576 [Bipolaris maydis]|nr:hypothetical protein BM1_00576 [Bipolaris maydis]
MLQDSPPILIRDWTNKGHSMFHDQPLDESTWGLPQSDQNPGVTRNYYGDITGTPISTHF